MPTVSWRPVRKASLSFVPTPSVPDTSTGSRYFFTSRAKSPPNPPMPGQHLGAEGGARQRLDEVDEPIALVDVDAGVAIGRGHAPPLPDARAMPQGVTPGATPALTPRSGVG